jgi:hypothetical protein
VIATRCVDDPSYRQGAATVVLDFRFDLNDPFTMASAAASTTASFWCALLARRSIPKCFTAEALP